MIRVVEALDRKEVVLIILRSVRRVSNGIVEWVSAGGSIIVLCTITWTKPESVNKHFAVITIIQLKMDMNAIGKHVMTNNI